MRFLTSIFISLYFIGCTPEYNLEDFKSRNDINKTTFMKNKVGCQKHSNLLASKSEGSKRAGEIAIDQNRYFLSCMKRKGWTLKTSS